ncbi:MAG: YfhO family protein [candidate division WOR-3 bacterium]
MAKKHRARPAPAQKPAWSIPEEKLHLYAVGALFLLPLFFYARFLFGSVMMFGTDFIGAGGYAQRHFMAEYIRSHFNIAFWQPQILSGQPTVAAFFGDLFYPTILLRLILPVHTVWAWTFFLHTFLAGLGAYLFLKELKLQTVAAFLAGVAYMFSGSLLTLAYAGHDGRLIGSALMPLAIFFLTRGINRRQFFWFLLTGLVIALQLLSGHIQKVYYTGLILVAWFIFCLIRTVRQEKKPNLAPKLICYFALGMFFAGCLAAIQYLPVYANLPYSARGAERGYEYATSWSMPVAEVFDLLTPKFSGGLENYWSKNPFKLHSEYLGILPLLFAVVAIIRSWKKPNVKFFLFAFVVTLLMAWGGNTPFYRLPYHLLPGIKMFRGPGMIFFLAGFSISVLAGFGVNHLLTEERKGKGHRFLLYAGGVLLIVLLFFLAARDAAANIFSPGPRLNQFQANYPALTGGLLFALFLWAIGTGLVFLFNRNRIAKPVFAGICAVIMTIDIGISLRLWDNQRGYIRSIPHPKEYFSPDEVVRFLKQDSSFYRVLPLHYDRSDEGELWLHNIYSVAGQIPNPLQSYQDFIGAGKSVMFQANNLLNPNFMNLLNIKYIITYNLPEDVSMFDPQSQQVISQLKSYFSQPQFERVFTGGRYTIFENKDLLPRAFITPDYQVVKDKDEVISLLMQKEFDPGKTALVYEAPGYKPVVDSNPSPATQCTILYYDANRIRVKANVSTPGILVLSENFHPDWQVTVDGKPAKLLQAFHTLRAVALEPGEHTVEFAYRSRSYQIGLFLSLLATLILLVFLIIFLLRRRVSDQNLQN